jgi:hypothetical protein
MDRACSANGERRKACRILVGKPEGRRPLGRQRRGWVDSITMDFRDIGWDGIDWIDVAQDRDQWMALVNTLMYLRVPYHAGNFLRKCTIASFSRTTQLRE